MSRLAPTRSAVNSAYYGRGPNGWLDLDRTIIESLSIRRAGADFVLTYFARQAAKLIS